MTSRHLTNSSELKRIFALSILTVSLTACGGGGGGSAPADSTPPVDTAPPSGETPPATEPDPITPIPEPTPVEPEPTPVEPEPTPAEPEPTPVEPDPVEVPTPNQGKSLLGEDAREISFNGNDAYFDFAAWQPQGSHRIVAWVNDLSDDKAYLASYSNGYLAVTKDSFIGRFNGQEVRLDNRFDFEGTGYVEIEISNGSLIVSDGQNSASTNNGAIVSQRYDSAMHFGNDYSDANLQALAFMDYSNDDLARSYTFNANQQVIEVSKSPSSENRLYNVSNADWQQVERSITAPKALLSTQAEWDAQFDNQFRNGRPILNSTNANDNGELAWHAHYWLRSYLAMAETYNDDKYIDYAVELIDHMFNYTDIKRASRNELNIQQQPYSSAPKAYLNDRNMVADGWRRPFGGFRVEVLSDGQILNPIMRVVDYIKSNNKTQYMAKADQYLNTARVIINTHSTSYSNTKNAAIPGSYFYVNDSNTLYGDSGLYTNPLPYNHNMTLSVAMIYVNKWTNDGEPEMVQKINDVIDFFNGNMIFNNDGTCTWDYAYDVGGNNKLEDTNHAHIDVGFMVVAEEEGYTDQTTVKCMTKTLTDKVFVAPTMVSYDVAGGGLSSRYDQVATSYDWAELAKFDSRIVEMNQHIMRTYGDPSWSRAYLGWATTLKWQNK